MRIKNERLKFDIQLFADGEISYKVTLDSNGAIKSMEKIEKTADKTSKKADELANKFKSIGTKMTVGLTVPITAFGTYAVKMASDLNEVQNVVDTTFESSSETINKFAKSAAEQFGISELSAKQFTGTMGAMLKSMGLGNKDITDMSIALSGLAGDMASFYNLDPEEAFEKLRSGISGETEPLKQLGINMSVVNLEAFAMSKGITKSYDSMTQAEQATLRYQYIMETTADAQGDYSKTADSTANKTRTTMLQFQTLSAELGQQLLPIVNDVLGALQSVIKWFNNLDASGKRVVLILGGIALAIGPVATAIGGLIKIGDGISNIGKHIALLKNGFSKFTGIVSKGATGLTSFAKTVGKAAINFGKLAVQAALATAKFIAQKAAMLASTIATNAMATAQSALNLIMSMNPITLIIIAIVALIAIIVTLWNKCEWFREGVMTVINAIWGAIQSVGSFIMGVFQNVFNFVSGIFTSLWNVIQTVVNTIVSIFSTAWNTIKNVATTVWNGILGLFSAGGKIFTGVVEGIAGVFKTIVNAIIKGINKVIRIPFDTINGILNFIRNTNILGFSPFLGLWGQNPLPVPQIPTLNVGTNYVEGEGLAYLHEGEAVVPKKYNPAVGGFGNYNQPIYVNVVADMDVDKFGKAFVRDIKTFSGGTKNSYNYGGGR